MARYIQRIAILGKERWIGWDIDGVGTEIPGLTLADEIPEEELRAKGIKEFRQLSFEQFIGMTAVVGRSGGEDLLDEDLDFRLDALQVGMERFRSQGVTSITRAMLREMFGSDGPIEHPRVQARFREWQASGGVQLVGRDDCYLRIVGRVT